jgi:hypothetical protein
MSPSVRSEASQNLLGEQRVPFLQCPGFDLGCGWLTRALNCWHLRAPGSRTERRQEAHQTTQRLCWGMWPIAISPVMSFSVTNLRDHQPAIVNVTERDMLWQLVSLLERQSSVQLADRRLTFGVKVRQSGKHLVRLVVQLSIRSGAKKGL